MKKYNKGYKFKSDLIKFSQQNVSEYANASGDQNPIHINKEFASKTIFKETIAHGMMIGAFLGEIIFLEYEDKWLESGSIDIKFKAPIFMDEKIQVFGEVINDENKIIKLNVSVIKNDGTEAIKGYATIKI
ncbi:MAG: MaoC/PaaZ C-terminal domain-containing protein [Dehalococcoidia bacterium]